MVSSQVSSEAGFLTTHYSLLTTHYSLLTTHYSLLTTHYFPHGLITSLARSTNSRGVE
jgi:hypothetical protein